MRTLRARLIFWSLLLSLLFMLMLLLSSVVLMNGMRRSELIQHEKNSAGHLADQLEVVLHDLDSRLWMINSSDALGRLMNTPRYRNPFLLDRLTNSVRQELTRYFGDSTLVEGLVVVGRNDFFAFLPPQAGEPVQNFSDSFHYQDFASNPTLSPYFGSSSGTRYASFGPEVFDQARSDRMLYQWLDGHVILTHSVFSDDNIILGEVALVLSPAIFAETVTPLLEAGSVLVLRDSAGRIPWQSGPVDDAHTLLLEEGLRPLSLTVSSYLPREKLRVDAAQMARAQLPVMLLLLLLTLPLAFLYANGYTSALRQLNESMAAEIPVPVGKRRPLSRYLWDRMPMRRALTLYFVLTVTLPTLAFSVVVCRQNYLDYKTLVIQDARRSVESLQTSVRQRLDTLDSISDIFTQNAAVVSLASADIVSSGINDTQQLSLDRLSHRMRLLTNRLLSVNLYTLEGRNVYSSQYLENQPASLFTGGFMRLLREGGTDLNYLGLVEELYPTVPLLFGRKLTLAGHSDAWGYVTMLVDQSFLTQSAGKTRLVKTGYCFLLSAEGEALTHNEGRTTAEILTPQVREELLTGTTDIRHSTLSPQYDLFYGFLRDAPLCVVGVLPRGEVLERVLPLMLISLLLTALYLALSILVAAKVSGQISKPLRHLRELMQTVGRGDWAEMHSQSRGEIGLLVEQYNQMVRRLEELIRENYTVRLQESHLQLAQKEAQFKALQQQINPHFLYNTLDAIKWMAHKKGAIEAYDMTVALGNFFRGVITQGVDIITVEEELSLLENYIYIQKIRFGERFDIRWELGENVRECKTLKLVLQPLVENAIVHGIEQVEEGGLITISAHQIEGQLEYVVSDNGAGIGEDMLARLQSLLRGETFPDQSTSIGLPNVYRRLKLHFGDAAQLDIHSRPGQGTWVVVRFPLIR